MAERQPSFEDVPAFKRTIEAANDKPLQNNGDLTAALEADRKISRRIKIPAVEGSPYVVLGGEE